MANDVTLPMSRRRVSRPVVGRVLKTSLSKVASEPFPAAPELIAFVKALARDLARADADALRQGRQADEMVDDRCKKAVSDDQRIRA